MEYCTYGDPGDFRTLDAPELNDGEWWRQHELEQASRHRFNSDAVVFRPGFEMEDQIGAVLEALTSSESGDGVPRKAMARRPKLQKTRKQKTEEKQAGIQRLIEAARAAAARADEFEANCIRLQAEVVELRSQLSKARCEHDSVDVLNDECSSTRCAKGSVETVASEVLDRVRLCLPELAIPVFKAHGIPYETPSHFEHRLRNVASHAVVPPGVHVGELRGKLVGQAQKGKLTQAAASRAWLARCATLQGQHQDDKCSGGNGNVEECADGYIVNISRDTRTLDAPTLPDGESPRATAFHFLPVVQDEIVQDGNFVTHDIRDPRTLDAPVVTERAASPRPALENDGRDMDSGNDDRVVPALHERDPRTLDAPTEPELIQKVNTAWDTRTLDAPVGERVGIVMADTERDPRTLDAPATTDTTDIGWVKMDACARAWGDQDDSDSSVEQLPEQHGDDDYEWEAHGELCAQAAKSGDCDQAIKVLDLLLPCLPRANSRAIDAITRDRDRLMMIACEAKAGRKRAKQAAKKARQRAIRGNHVIESCKN